MGSITFLPGHVPTHIVGHWLYTYVFMHNSHLMAFGNVISLHRRIHGEEVCLVAEQASSPECPTDRPHRSF